MAEFVGAHVEMGVAVKTGSSELFYPIWSETIALGGTTRAAAPDPSIAAIAQNGVPVFRVRAQSAAPIFVAVGKVPDATKAVSTAKQDTRTHLLASERRDIPAIFGDKVSIVAAI